MSGRFFWLIGLLLFGWGCGGGLAPGGFRAELVPVDTIHLQEPDTLFLGEFLTVTATLEPFRLYVPDRRLRRIVVYDSLGHPLQLIGRTGFDEPGTLRRPSYVLVHGDRLYADETQSRFAIFHRTGRFAGYRRLPEGYGATGQGALHSLDASHLVVGSVAYAEPCASWFEPACEETRAFSVIDTAFQRVTGRFGLFPALYQEKVFAGRWSMLDVLPERGLAAVVYQLSSEVHFYRVSPEGGVLLRRVPTAHPAWRQITEAMPPTLSPAEMKEIALRVSGMSGVYFVSDTLVVAHFRNLQPGYYVGEGIDLMQVDSYGVVVSVTGSWQQPLAFSGPVLGWDAAYRLYVLLSDEPDRRLIGRFRVEVRR